jgi:hypothetical protein
MSTLVFPLNSAARFRRKTTIIRINDSRLSAMDCGSVASLQIVALSDKQLRLTMPKYTVVGVMPPAFSYPNLSDVWVLGRDRNAVSMSLLSQFPEND